MLVAGGEGDAVHAPIAPWASLGAQGYLVRRRACRASGEVLSPFPDTGSSWVTPVISIVTGPPSGSVAPVGETVTNA